MDVYYGVLVLVLSVMLAGIAYIVSKDSIETVANEFLKTEAEVAVKDTRKVLMDTFGEITLVNGSLVDEAGNPISDDQE